MSKWTVTIGHGSREAGGIRAGTVWLSGLRAASATEATDKAITWAGLTPADVISIEVEEHK